MYNESQQKVSRRGFLQTLALAGGAVLIGARPQTAVAQESIAASPTTKPFESVISSLNLQGAVEVPLNIVKNFSEGPRPGQPYRFEQITAEDMVQIPDSEIFGIGRFRIQALNGAPLSNQIRGGIRIGDGGSNEAKNVLATTLFFKGADGNKGDLMQVTADVKGSENKSSPDQKIGEVDLGESSDGSFVMGWRLSKDSTVFTPILPDANFAPEINYGRSMFREGSRQLQIWLYNSNQARIVMDDLKVFQAP